MSNVDARKLAFVIVIGSAIAACSGNQNGEQGADQDASAPAIAEMAAPTNGTSLTLESISIGNYVQDSTFAVGGVASQFSAADPLFASVKWTGDAASANLLVKLLDSSGAVVLERSAATLTTMQTSTNFTLRGASDARLDAGTYRVDVYANGDVKTGVDIKIVD